MAMYKGRRVLQVLRFGSIVKVGGQPVETFDADTKLDKQTGNTTYNKAYIKLANGNQGLLDMTVEASLGTIPLRDGSGRLRCKDPQGAGEEVVNVGYAIDHFSCVYKHDVTILLDMAGTGNDFYKIRGHVFNNSSTAITTLSECFSDLICEYGGDQNGNGYAVQKIPNGFAYGVFTSPRSAFIFTSSAGVITFINPSDTSVVSDVSVSDVAAKL